MDKAGVRLHNEYFLIWPFLVLNQQYLEALAMLDIKQQTMAQENMCCDKSGFAEASGLEVGKHVEKLNRRDIFYFPFLCPIALVYTF